MKKLFDGKHTFEIVESVPKGYMIWNIGKNMVDGYLPLCKLKNVQPFEGGREIDATALKAIKCEGAQTVLSAIGGGQDTIEKMERYIKRYSNSKRALTLIRVEHMKKALEVMYTLHFD